jgi:fucose permease
MNESTNATSGTEPLHHKRLFSGICLALIPTGASFALIANVLGQFKKEFLLTNAEVGSIAGAAIWGMALSLLFLGPLLESFGMKKATWAAFVGHLLGLSLMLSAALFGDNPATAYWLLMGGAACLAIGNGMIEVAGNPLTAALFPEQKAHKLNIFHAFFPLSILIASLIGWVLNMPAVANIADGFFIHWTFQLAIIYIPILFYGILVLPQKFPKTENAEAGLPAKEMFRFTFTSPLMWAFLLMMAIAIGLELGVARWIPLIFNSIDVPGTLLLAWLSFVMMTLRFFSGSIMSKVSPVGLLAIGSIFMAAGLFLYSTAGSTAIAFIAATMFGIGVAFNFPTIVGLVAERLPKTGSLGIVLTAGIGLGAAGVIGTPGIGKIADNQLGGYLEDEQRAPTIALLETVETSYPPLIEQAEAAEDPVAEYGYLASDLQTARDAADTALKEIEANTTISGPATASALRAIGASVVDKPEDVTNPANEMFANKAKPGAASVTSFASQGAANSAAIANRILVPAEGYAGQRSLRLLAWVPLVLTVFFTLLYLNDKKKGGYKAQSLADSH